MNKNKPEIPAMEPDEIISTESIFDDAIEITTSRKNKINKFFEGPARIENNDGGFDIKI